MPGHEALSNAPLICKETRKLEGFCVYCVEQYHKGRSKHSQQAFEAQNHTGRHSGYVISLKSG